LVGYPDGRVQAIAEGRLSWYGQPWSPDGTKFVFWRDDGPPYHVSLFMADLQTGGVQALDFVHDTSYFWSPDGRYLLYSEDSDDYDIRVMVYNFESAENTILATFSRENQGIYYYLAGWSPDSRKVAYVAEIEGQYDLFVVDVETLTIQQLTDDSETEVHVAWSPVDNQLLVTTNPEPDPFIVHPFSAQKLYLMDENGEGRLLAEFDNLNQLSWSPDGQQIAFSDDGLLCILTVDDLNQTCPLQEIFPAGEFAASFNFRPTWSPDVQWFAFQVNKRNDVLCIQSYLLHLSTSEVVRLEEDDCFQTQFHWSPTVP
jgi:Tol biopolymer transport system component